MKALIPITSETGIVRFHPHGGPGGGECCQCPAHKRKHDFPMTLISCDPRLVPLRKDANGAYHVMPLGYTISPQDGGVYARTASSQSSPTPSTAPDDAHIVFEWQDNGNTLAQTNALTLIGMYFMPYLWGINSGLGSDSVLMGVRPPPEGWVTPPQPGKLNAIKLDTFLGMPGQHVLTLDGDPAFRVFASNSTNGTPLLVAGQSVTNGLPPDIWVETRTNGTATLRYTYTGEGIASNLTHTAMFPLSSSFGIIPAGQVVFTNATSNAVYRLTLTPGSGSDFLWTISGGAARFASGPTAPGSSSTASGTTVWVNPGPTGGVYTITCNAVGNPSLEATAGLVVSREISWSPPGDKIYVWYPIADFHFGTEFVDYMVANYQGWETGANNPLTVFHDPSPDDDDFGTCTLENFKAMANGGILYIQTHGNIGMIEAVRCKTEAAANAWKGNEPDMYVDYDYDDGYWKVLVKSEWFLNNWKPLLDQRKALVFLKACYGADGGTYSIASSIGGQTVFAAHGIQIFAAVDTFFQAIVEMMNGTSFLFKDDRSALGAFLTVKDKMNADPLAMIGNGRSTLCPAPQQVFPTSPEAAKAKWGCILFDTYMNNAIPAGTAVVPVTGTINSRQWGQDAFYIDFTHNGQKGKAKAVSENCRSWGQPNKRMDGNGKAPLIVDDDKEWEW